MRVKLFATYRQIIGRKTLEVEPPVDILDLLTSLSDEYGGELRAWLLSSDGSDIGPNAIILVNGRNVLHMNGARTTVGEGDIVSLFPLVAGG
jgi:molybdopterin synthase sulfur carrier subunit